MSFQTNSQLEQMAFKLKIPLIGVFSKDTLPNRPQDGGYIINMEDDTDEHGNHLSGTHWVAVYIEKGQACYFDSFGFPPPVNIQIFLQHYRPYAYNKKDIQNPMSGYCGKYCLYFLWFMVHHKEHRELSKRLDKFCDLWSDDYEKNLTLLKKYLLIN